MKILWTSLAERRVAEAFAWVAADRPASAARWLERLLNRVKQLGDFPDQGRAVPEVARPEIRELIVVPYRMVYRRDPARIVILAARHSRRRLDRSEILPRRFPR